MADTGIARNTITYSAAISACEKGGKVERALALVLVLTAFILRGRGGQEIQQRSAAFHTV